MSWKFPKYKIEDDQTISVDEVVENALEVATEIGQLDENNWRAVFVSDRTTMSPGIALVSHHATRLTGIGPTGHYDSNIGNVPASDSWTAIDGLSASYGTSGGLTWILGSFSTSSAVTGSSSDDCGGMLWSIRVDGQVIVESVIGSQELDNDATVQNTSEVPSAGVARYRIPIVVEALIPLAEGQHIIEVVGMPLLGQNGVLAAPLGGNQYGSTIVSVGQLIVLELLR